LVQASAVTALHTSRHLRIATDASGRRLDLWPQPGSGNRSNAFSLAQGVNLLLALSANEPIRSAEIVAAFRSLLPRPGGATWAHTRKVSINAPTVTITEEFTGKEPLLRGPTFGDDLDCVVEGLAASDTPNEVRELLCQAELLLTLAPRFGASFVMPMAEGAHVINYGERPPAASEAYRLLRGSTGEIVGAMEALALIWRETQEARHQPANETAATHPCQGTNAAAPSQPSATMREPGRPTPPVLSEREIALNRYAAGPPFTKERPNARYRQLSADPAGG
jgi:hypothetical protein